MLEKIKMKKMYRINCKVTMKAQENLLMEIRGVMQSMLDLFIIIDEHSSKTFLKENNKFIIQLPNTETDGQ